MSDQVTSVTHEDAAALLQRLGELGQSGEPTVQVAPSDLLLAVQFIYSYMIIHEAIQNEGYEVTFDGSVFAGPPVDPRLN